MGKKENVTKFNKVTREVKDRILCEDCISGNQHFNEVRDDWRKKKSYYESLKKGPGVKHCIGFNGERCVKMIHGEISACGVAYVCRNGMCFKEDDIECENWVCYDCNLKRMGGGRRRVRK